MIELRRDDILEELEEKEFEAIDLEDDSLEISELGSARFEPHSRPSQSRGRGGSRFASHGLTLSLLLPKPGQNPAAHA